MQYSLFSLKEINYQTAVLVINPSCLGPLFISDLVVVKAIGSLGLLPCLAEKK